MDKSVSSRKKTFAAPLQPRRAVKIPKKEAAKEKPKQERKQKQKQEELLFYGRHISEKIAAVRRQDIIRVYCTEETLPSLRELLQWCAQERKAYHVVSPADMQRITQSVHHEGIALLARVEPVGSSEDLLRLVGKRTTPLLILDGVQNPHNLGTIMRVMASFGWPALVGSKDLPALSSSAARMSEGGAAYVRSFACEDLGAMIRSLQARGYLIVGTSSHAQASLYEAELPEKCAFILGSEVNGMSASVRKLIDLEVAIPATGQVESLNVAVASGLLLGEHCRRHGLWLVHL